MNELQLRKGERKTPGGAGRATGGSRGGGRYGFAAGGAESGSVMASWLGDKKMACCCLHPFGCEAMIGLLFSLRQARLLWLYPSVRAGAAALYGSEPIEVIHDHC